MLAVMFIIMILIMIRDDIRHSNRKSMIWMLKRMLSNAYLRKY